MSTQLSPSAYKQVIEEDLEELYKHMPDTLERQHIEDVLKYSIKHFYPGFVDTAAHTEALRERVKELEAKLTESEKVNFDLAAHQCDHWQPEEHGDWFCGLKAENTRYREALERIANYNYNTRVVAPYHIANEALKNN